MDGAHNLKGLLMALGTYLVVFAMKLAWCSSRCFFRSTPFRYLSPDVKLDLTRAVPNWDEKVEVDVPDTADVLVAEPRPA